MTVRCIDCGHEQPEGESHCQRCGHRFDGGYEGAFEDWSPDGPEEEFYYTYEWFGVEYKIRKWRWDLGIAAIVGMGIIGSIAFLSVGWWANAIIFLLTTTVSAFLYHRIGKKKHGIGALFVVGFLVVFPGMLAAFVPWHELHEDYLEEKYEPKFSDTITYSIEDESRIVCDGLVVNSGRTGSQAMITFTVWGGMPGDGQESDVFDAFATGTVTTAWIAPDGGSTYVHWECTLSYFNSYGSVQWTIEAYP